MTETAHPPVPTEAVPSAPRGTRLSRDARRTQLLGAARDVFAAQGYHAAAMDDIAERAGVSKPVLYQHFPSKLELYQALLTTYAAELVGRLRGAIEEFTDNEQRVRAAVSAYFDFVTGDGESYRLVFESDLRSEPEAAEILDKALTECIDLVAGVVTQDAGLDADRARLLAVGLVGLSQVTARYWLDSGHSVPKEEAVELMYRLAWRGLSHFPMIHD
ncbi:TetR/AcrR family transcriptional regulator [Pseudonocardia spinosispora]|uniref:TetR/AcrR family transcriptional regulator n=1 Tax=Pseudonocardia spinosispora TaxID=103441 RepID=UPI0003FDAC2B|nr:TetR/AcrR family transcriptional regulator [Pseudonocardia spinosispora]